MEVDCPCLFPHEAMYHVITIRGMDVKHGVEPKSGPILGEHETTIVQSSQ